MYRIYYTFDIPYQELRIGEIGYVIGEKWHGKGYGTEAVKKMISEYLSKDRLNNPVSMSPLSGDRKPQIRF